MPLRTVRLVGRPGNIQFLRTPAANGRKHLLVSVEGVSSSEPMEALEHLAMSEAVSTVRP
jgi:hypothetical protein